MMEQEAVLGGPGTRGETKRTREQGPQTADRDREDPECCLVRRIPAKAVSLSDLAREEAHCEDPHHWRDPAGDQGFLWVQNGIGKLAPQRGDSDFRAELLLEPLVEVRNIGGKSGSGDAQQKTLASSQKRGSASGGSRPTSTL
jgi:hypothetical protein